MDSLKSEQLKLQLLEIVRNRIDYTNDITDVEIRLTIENAVLEKAEEQYISVSKKVELIETLYNSMRKLDVLQPLIDDPEITEIMINGPESIFVERNGRITELENIKFESEKKLLDVINQVVEKVNRTVDESSPIVDARLLDGSRVNVIIPPVALDGALLTIRKFPEKAMTMERLIGFGSLTEDVADILQKMVRSKYNIFISGGTGSGKTSFLNALSNFIPDDERVVTIEDSAELQLVNIRNLARLETRDKNSEGIGEITVRNLIKASLRIRPDRIIVGEVRGAEALDMLQAMNTGHDGSLSTGHANSTKDMLSRLETMVISGADIPIHAIRQQIVSAIDVMIHLGRLRDKSRRVLAITEVESYVDGEIRLNPLYEFVETGETEDKKVIGELRRSENSMIHIEKFSAAGLDNPLEGV